MASNDDDSAEEDESSSAMDEQSQEVGSSDGISERMAAGLTVEGTRSSAASDKSKTVQGAKARLDPQVLVSEEVCCGKIHYIVLLPLRDMVPICKSLLLFFCRL